jgi:cytochrome c556
MRRLLIGAVALMILSIGGGVRADKPADVATFMRLKLAHSQKLLEGIALEDFKLIEKSAQDLSLLSREENWQVFQTPDYLRHSEEFRRAAESVREAAAKKNVDGAALGYVGLTLSCVNCHKYVRDVRMAGTIPGQPSAAGE